MSLCIFAIVLVAALSTMASGLWVALGLWTELRRAREKAPQIPPQRD